MVAKHCKFTECHLIVHFNMDKMLNFMLRVFYHNLKNHLGEKQTKNFLMMLNRKNLHSSCAFLSLTYITTTVKTFLSPDVCGVFPTKQFSDTS